MPSFKNLAERLSKITGRRVLPTQLEHFSRGLGDMDHPVTIVDGEASLRGYSEENGMVIRSFTAEFTLILQDGYKITAQKVFELFRMQPRETVRKSLVSLLNLYDTKDEIGGPKDPTGHISPETNGVASYNLL